MIFPDFKAVVDYINSQLGDFIEQFRSERKRLAGLGKKPTGGRLFTFDPTKGRNWAINEGAGTEVQYHIGLNPVEKSIYYGIGFNTQYVPFTNDKSMVDHARPFMNAFLYHEQKIRRMLLDYYFVNGDRSHLLKPQPDDYVLFGKEVSCSLQNGVIDVPDDQLVMILGDLKHQFESYQLIFETRNNQPAMNSQTIEVINLLRYKMQIILQGPPGTGKTKTAKELAHELALPKSITQEDIQTNVPVGLKIVSADKYTEYTIKDIGTHNITVALKNSPSTYKPSYKEIINAYEIRMWNGKQRGGNDPYAAAIAKYLFQTIPLNTISLIQFHPSYSYEDFVRGIVAEPSGNAVAYSTRNKLLGEFADRAWSEYKLGQPSVARKVLGTDERVDEALLDFSEYLLNKMDESDRLMLTPKVYVSRVTETSVRYNADGWQVDGGVPFSDIRKMYLAGVNTRKEVKSLSTLSKTAKSLSTYWLKVLDTFRKFLKDESVDIVPSSDQSQVAPRNYVLIIDEINRANLSSVLGELVYALEYRGEEVDSMYEVDGSNKIILPPNLFIIGTMNTADRSVGHIDYALRRRFAFVDVHPKDLTTELGGKFHKALFDQVAALFEHTTNLSKEFEPKDVQLGHSYFIDKTEDGGSMDIRLEYEIKPILREYIRDGILVGDDIPGIIESLIA